MLEWSKLSNTPKIANYRIDLTSINNALRYAPFEWSIVILLLTVLARSSLSCFPLLLSKLNGIQSLLVLLQEFITKDLNCVSQEVIATSTIIVYGNYFFLKARLIMNT